MQQLRQARQIRRRPYQQGEVVELTPGDGQLYSHITFRTPSGLIGLAPVKGNSYHLWLLEAGTWAYRWGDGEQHALEVVEAPGEPAPVEPTFEVDPEKLPPMTVLRRPRF